MFQGYCGSDDAISDMICFAGKFLFYFVTYEHYVNFRKTLPVYRPECGAN